MFNVGSQELIIVLFVVLMLFGSKRIPEVARTFGKGVKDFRKAMAGLESELKLDLDLDEKPSRPAPKLGAPEGTAPVRRAPGSDPAVPTDLTNEADLFDPVESEVKGPDSVPAWKATDSSKLPTQPQKPSPLPKQPEGATPGEAESS